MRLQPLRSHLPLPLPPPRPNLLRSHLPLLVRRSCVDRILVAGSQLSVNNQALTTDYRQMTTDNFILPTSDVATRLPHAVRYSSREEEMKKSYNNALLSILAAIIV